MLTQSDSHYAVLQWNDTRINFGSDKDNIYGSMKYLNKLIWQWNIKIVNSFGCEMLKESTMVTEEGLVKSYENTAERQSFSERHGRFNIQSRSFKISPVRRRTTTWTYGEVLSIKACGTYVNNILFGTQPFIFNEWILQLLSAKLVFLFRWVDFLQTRYYVLQCYGSFYLWWNHYHPLIHPPLPPPRLSPRIQAAKATQLNQ